MIRRFNPSAPYLFARLQPQDLLLPSTGDVLPLSFLQGRRVFAFCGIARPENFFQSLEALGVSLSGRMAFRDHHRYSFKDLKEIGRRGEGADLFVTTEKDFVKLSKLSLPFPLYLLRVVLQVQEEPLWRKVEEVLSGR